MFSRLPFALFLPMVVGAQAPVPPPPLPTIYLDFQVEKQVIPSPKNRAPEYPKDLRAANVEGEVVASFVVDSSGRVILSTFKVIKSNQDLFSKAVESVLPSLRFTPAQIGRARVAQRVQMPFEFRIATRDTTAAQLSSADMSRRIRRVIQTMRTDAPTTMAIARTNPTDEPPDPVLITDSSAIAPTGCERRRS